MTITEKTKITVAVNVKAPAEIAWKYFTAPAHITKWNNASVDWHTTKAEVDLREGGKFVSRMEAKDGSFGFDFGGIYDRIKTNELIEYTLGDGRKVSVAFISNANETKIVETFEAENQNSTDMQRAGWLSILENFKKYTETNL